VAKCAQSWGHILSLLGVVKCMFRARPAMMCNRHIYRHLVDNTKIAAGTDLG